VKETSTNIQQNELLQMFSSFIATDLTSPERYPSQEEIELKDNSRRQSIVSSSRVSVASKAGKCAV
jgi:hypothetical protein